MPPVLADVPPIPPDLPPILPNVAAVPVQVPSVLPDLAAVLSQLATAGPLAPICPQIGQVPPALLAILADVPAILPQVAAVSPHLSAVLHPVPTGVAVPRGGLLRLGGGERQGEKGGAEQCERGAHGRAPNGCRWHWRAVNRQT